MHPILITVPCSTAATRSQLERTIINAINQDDVGGPAAFWQEFYFYPYRNTADTPLGPAQLYDVIDSHLGPFVPNDALYDPARMQTLDEEHPQRYSDANVPSYVNEAEQCTVDSATWGQDRLFVVVDDIDGGGHDVAFVKLFHIDVFAAYRRACRRAREAGNQLTPAQAEDADMGGSDDDDDDDDDVGDDVTSEFHFAAKFLGRPTADWCRMRGIQATPIQSSRVATAVINLAQANTDFESYVISEQQYEEQRQQANSSTAATRRRRQG